MMQGLIVLRRVIMTFSLCFSPVALGAIDRSHVPIFGFLHRAVELINTHGYCSSSTVAWLVTAVA